MELVTGRYNTPPTTPTPATKAGTPVPVLVDAYGRIVTSPSSQLTLVDQYGNPLSFDFDQVVDFGANSKALQILTLILAELRAIRLAVSATASEGQRFTMDDFDPGLLDSDPNLNTY